MKKTILAAWTVIAMLSDVYGQDTTQSKPGSLPDTTEAHRKPVPQKDTVPVKDLSDVIRKLLKKEKKAEPAKQPGVVVLPSLGYNPSFGFIIGAKISGGRQTGHPSNTNYSIYGLEGMYTSKGIVTAQARHNIFTEGNKWNLQGNWQLSRYGVVDYGLGTNTKFESKGFIFNEYPTKNADSAYPIKYNYVRLFEKVYYKVGSKLFAGAGVNLNFYSDIEDEKQTNNLNTPHQRYSIRHGIDPDKYSANGLILALQYNSREHPIRSYGGIYADWSFLFYHEWFGSTTNSTQIQYDFRKYFSLSRRNPEHVLAFWHWASYKLSGVIPYLALPCTASDTYTRSGRAYTLSRFKGPSYAYFETEYRYPILRNKLVSGVLFLNMQTASNDLKLKVFEAWVPGAGAGLRILFQKESRSALCIDFSKGKYGSSGIFFGLNEVF